MTPPAARRLAATAVLLSLLVACADPAGPAGGTRPTALPPQPTGPTVAAADFGATPDDDVDDGAALQAALDSLAPGETLLLAPGRYLHGDVLSAHVPGTAVAGRGSVLTATDEARSAFRLDADRITVRDTTFAVAATTRRWDEPDQHKVLLGPWQGLALSGVTVDGSAASGVFVAGSGSFLLEGVRVRDTRADGIHLTSGAHDGSVLDAEVSGSGDDGVAVVSYDGEPECHDIVVERPRVSDNTHGRGVSVVGGRAITWTGVEVRNSAAAAVYVAVEDDPLRTLGTAGVVVDGALIVGANTDAAVDHGAVLVYAGRSGAGIEDVLMEDVEIVDTRAGASRQVAVLSDGGPIAGVVLRDFVVEGGPAEEFGSNVDPGAYERTGW